MRSRAIGEVCNMVKESAQISGRAKGRALLYPRDLFSLGRPVNRERLHHDSVGLNSDGNHRQQGIL